MGANESTAPIPVAEVTLDLSQAAPERERPLPERVRLPEPMLRYRCNEKGCCCSGWRIAFRAPDLVRLGKVLDSGDREKLTRDVEFRVRTDFTGDRVVDEVVLTDDDGLCRFLDHERARCGLHAKYGLSALPDLCVDFPVATFAEDGHHALYFDPVCPSVLEALAESDAPMALAEVNPATRDAGFQLRSKHSRGFVALTANGKTLTPNEVDAVRSVVLASLEDLSRPLWEHLAAIERAFLRFGRGEPFAISYEGDPKPFFRHLGACLGAHGKNVLEGNLRAYQRFIHAIPIDDSAFAWDALGHHLEQWGEAYERWLGPSEDALRPLLLRYLALCHATPYAAPDGDFAKFAGSVTHKLATALRYAAVLGACLSREVDRAVMQVAIGASEYFYRSRSIDPGLMPWLESA